VPPVKGTKEILAKTDPQMASSELVFPSDATLANTHQFDSKALNNQTYVEQWQKVLGA
jgi:hypothetical protein